MGAIADGIVAYAQPLIDTTDGSIEQVNKALTISQCCWNLALMPEEAQADTIRQMRLQFKMDDAEFESFRTVMIIPMIERHKEMFPLMHNRGSTLSSPRAFSTWKDAPSPKPVQKFAGTDPYAPCPCNSGKKYKFCCRSKGR
ncbi:hypothetical protein BH10PLA2_BH10PLA2_03740 [soil metagenome]